jgi:hypothetical protein
VEDPPGLSLPSIAAAKATALRLPDAPDTAAAPARVPARPTQRPTTRFCCLIAAALRCEIEVLLPCAMSNHYHVVIYGFASVPVLEM